MPMLRGTGPYATPPNGRTPTSFRRSAERQTGYIASKVSSATPSAVNFSEEPPSENSEVGSQDGHNGDDDNGWEFWNENEGQSPPNNAWRHHDSSTEDNPPGDTRNPPKEVLGHQRLVAVRSQEEMSMQAHILTFRNFQNGTLDA
ncbi:hypothetical protein COCNU_07G004380 [Cocos nucifera]|uniref:Uncharacterized protein n=1 Tax=Cocos nucifera TaxID=13894 RepID=A0A8K0IEG6_COCNU|nr:hypothetical protein COCNU_07G004380 [Cocos nucifera]